MDLTSSYSSFLLPPSSFRADGLVERGHQFAGEQLHAVQPARFVIPIIAHEDQGAERPRLLDQEQQPAQHLVGAAGDDLLAHQVVQVAVGVAHGQVALVELAAQALVEQAADVLEVAAQRVGARPLAGLAGGVGEEEGAGHLEVGPPRLPACLQRPGLVGLPQVGDHVAGDQAVGERLQAAAAGEAHARRVAAHAGHGDGGMRLLKGFGDIADPRLGVHVLLEADLPELALDRVRRIGGPQLQDHVDGLIDHGGGVLRLGAVQFLVGRHAAGTEGEVEPPLGQMVEEGEPAGDVGGVVLVEADGGRPQADAPRLAQGAGDEDLRHHDVFILHRVMLADPEFGKAHLLGADDQLQVLVVALPRRLGRVVIRHDEHPVANRLHSLAHARPPFVCLPAGSDPRAARRSATFSHTPPRLQALAAARERFPFDAPAPAAYPASQRPVGLRGASLFGELSWHR
jgi:hypothetical protein